MLPGFSYKGPDNPALPATVTAANNGVSLNGTIVVLGNDVGGTEAALLNNREIPCGAFGVEMNGENTCLTVAVQNPADVALNALTVTANALDGAGVARVTAIRAQVDFANVQDALAASFVPSMAVEHYNNGNSVVVDTSFDSVLTAGVGITMINGNNEPTMGTFLRDPGGATYEAFVGVDGSTTLQFLNTVQDNGLLVNLSGPGCLITPDGSNQTFSGATLDVKGPITMQRFVSPQAASPVAVSSTLDNHKVFTNDGAGAAVTFNLPAAVAGLSYTFYVQNANGIVIDAAAGDTIRILALVSAAGGNVSSVTVGSSVVLVAINATEWVAIASLGLWI